MAQGQRPKLGSKWASSRALPSDRSLWACFRASCLQPAWFSDLPETRVKTALPPGLGACACFGLGLKRRVGEEGGDRQMDRTLAWGVPVLSVLFPLLLLSKLVSKLDVLPGQFEVALLPPPTPSSPANTQVARCQCGPGGLRRRDRLTDPPSITGGSRKTPFPPPLAKLRTGQ